MATKHLRVVRAAGTAQSPRPTVTMTLRRLYPLLVHAHRHQHAWLRDLADDEVAITEDLADVLHEFESLLDQRRGA